MGQVVNTINPPRYVLRCENENMNFNTPTPIYALIRAIWVRNNTGNAVTGLALGTTNGGNDIVAGHDVGANEYNQIPPAEILKWAPWGDNQDPATLYVKAANWGGGSPDLDIYIEFGEL